MNKKIFENIVNHKISTVTADELLKYAKQFNIAVNKQQANLIVEYLRESKVNIFNDMERTRLIKEIAKVVGPKTAKEVNQLFLQFSK
ncbi:DUF2624 domain-containing protein [Bacillus aquiflavi]|uniref:DUF2624 domain-containing protein n=1 Tax=Bacillus aquiflavi TaxID=2672567 RepID=A0A6B3VWR4_9BACI|nr:DUF2624 domain-containing protein [Bacillus aquiflavi]MBA4535848.1 DUF2624 domain-containing protein [Bacillus aquiflavi]NEY80223.1 DUF2624 domain-containing protein [Bacillus aquiflavi]UAC47273.1 DUF2624 domain-containing protein [Bacillus aquiflavi]